MTEEYKICFENYEISNLGNCRKKKLNTGDYKEIKGSINSKGYKYFQVQRNGKRVNKLFHHLVAKCFISERPNNLVIDHIDRNKLNNNVSNLRYITQDENMRNTDKYMVDCKLEGIERKRYIQKKSEEKIKQSKKYYCKICNIKCRSPYELKVHNEGPRHIKKINTHQSKTSE